MNTVETLDDIRQLPLGTKVYQPTETNIKWWYYAGINPKSNNSIMLINSGNIQDITGVYIGDKKIKYWLDYEEVKQQLLKNALDNVEKIKRIYLKDTYDTI